MATRPDDEWELATWVGVRREQLRRALRLTLRGRLEARDEMAELARRFERMRAERGPRHGPVEPKE